MFDRRTFLAAGAAAVAAGGTRTASADDHKSSRATFSLDYAPHFGSFAKTAGSDASCVGVSDCNTDRSTSRSDFLTDSSTRVVSR
ncbi:MAG: hypothetical protein AAF907_16100 [Planctomycetota bacterium]